MKPVFRVKTHFLDLQDNSYNYQEDDLYPRNGYEPTEDRIKELSSNKNRRLIPLIETVKYEELKLNQLKEIAKRNNIEGYSSKNKSQLIKLLKNRGDENV
ncbi:Rho termination factor N-terminal domain-containing protein [Staphylococcus haemolyticus]|uniref:Rho termination factor N-terminal domain-containing protein n=1 Tax=Staphylococcus haemolyticus TaxID=1283 RepID=UPI001F0A2801|nr:Rho termination factor N-terminal domain-containing protein [Staphylococcus haemolyticus]